ncbi:TetR/AcrR family transcriptional regulator [Pseudomonas sp. CAU 1711]|uniref:TetR/AcrR family transcriptional regulator n=1 Tax=Pseudomonas sp. CAU 1711 TaxID=3140356 RepID=UPI00326086C3
MRYPEDHKAKTYQRILDEAALRFRRDGVLATGLQPLMKALGLTHGGFYAHFKSKDDLVEKALQQSIDQLQGSIAEIESSPRPLQAFIGRYLSDAHRAAPGAGCPLPTISAELGQHGQPSPITDKVVRERLELIASNLRGDNAEAESALVLSALIGALVLSRSVADEELAKRLLADTRQQLMEMTAS